MKQLAEALVALDEAKKKSSLKAPKGISEKIKNLLGKATQGKTSKKKSEEALDAGLLGLGESTGITKVDEALKRILELAEDDTPLTPPAAPKVVAPETPADESEEEEDEEIEDAACEGEGCAEADDRRARIRKMIRQRGGAEGKDEQAPEEPAGDDGKKPLRLRKRMGKGWGGPGREECPFKDKDEQVVEPAKKD
jgi:hypothetical protein